MENIANIVYNVITKTQGQTGQRKSHKDRISLWPSQVEQNATNGRQ